MHRVGRYHIYTVYIRYFWQGNHQIYGHMLCIYTVLANPSNAHVLSQILRPPFVLLLHFVWVLANMLVAISCKHL
jgi:hypothetical protein